MAGYFGITGSMFGTSNNSTNWMSGVSSLYSDYNSIRSGSYYKLLKAYYGQDSSGKSRVEDVVSKKTNTEKKELTQTKADAADLQDSAKKLSARGKESLFTKREITAKDENGKETTALDYDREAIADAVTAFVRDYNDLIESGSGVSSTNILRKTLQLTQSTAANKNMLSDVGISITDGNKLSVNSDTLNKADVNKLKSLFEGADSYAGRVSDKAAQIAKAAVTEASKSSSLYTSAGGYYNSVQSYNSLFDSLY
ncbi:MAG: hypothetical protein J6B06_05730 [Lachnospiraceae bacterium]|nr:hypothetical protein [Lachnospiraceae bacterium]